MMKHFLLLLIFCAILIDGYGQFVIGFSKSEITTLEAKAEKIVLPVSFSGKWPDKSGQMKISLKFGGEASKEYDYTINKEQITISKDSIYADTFEISIINDAKYDDGEAIQLTLVSDDSTAKVDAKRRLITIKIIDDEPSDKDIIVNRVNKDRDTSDVIGVLRLRNCTIKEYLDKDSGEGKREMNFDKSSSEATSTLLIDKVELSFSEGVMNEIKVYAKKSGDDAPIIFTNIVDGRFLFFIETIRKYSVSLRHQMYNDGLYNLPLYRTLRDGGSRFILLSDVLYYDPRIGRNYPPGDADDLTLTCKDNFIKITNNTSLTNYINLNIYTDFLSLIKTERGNGLVQTEASARIYMNTSPLKNRASFLLNYIEPSVRYSRLEAGYNYVALDSGRTTIDRMLLNQRSFFQAGMKMNLLKKNFRFYSSLEINGFFNINWSNIRGQQISNDPNQAPEYKLNEVNLYSWGVEPKLIIPQYRNFGVTLAYSLFAQSVYNKNKVAFTNTEWRWYSVPEVEMFYFPVASSNDKLFLRLRSYIDNGGYNSNFLQMQVGYKGQFKFKAK